MENSTKPLHNKDTQNTGPTVQGGDYKTEILGLYDTYILTAITPKLPPVVSTDIRFLTENK